MNHQTKIACLCECSDHFDLVDGTSLHISHDFGERFNQDQIENVQTEYGWLNVCRDCAEHCHD